MLAGATGILASTLILSAVAAPEPGGSLTPAYEPHDASYVVAHVPRRSPQERAVHDAATRDPENLDLAVELARAEIARARELSDTRYLGRAQARLRRWWGLANPPPEVLYLRATIRQALHEFDLARRDLDRLVRTRPTDTQAHLTRAIVATVVGDYATARDSCEAIAVLATPLVAITCRAPLDALSGSAESAYVELARALAAGRAADPATRTWALTTLAELAIQRGDSIAATLHLRRVLELDPDDSYAMALLADVLLAQGETTAVTDLLRHHEHIDGLLLRVAIAEHRHGGHRALALALRMQERFERALARGDRTHLREQARFALEVTGDARAAARLALENWNVQHELADARLLASAAVALKSPELATPVLQWMRTHGVHDAQLDRTLRGIGAP